MTLIPMADPSRHTRRRASARRSPRASVRGWRAYGRGGPWLPVDVTALTGPQEYITVRRAGVALRCPEGDVILPGDLFCDYVRTRQQLRESYCLDHAPVEIETRS